MPTRSRNKTSGSKHLRCLYTVPQSDMRKLERIQKFMKGVLRDGSVALPQFLQDEIYVVDRELCLRFESCGFAPYDGVLDPLVVTGGKTTVQPLIGDKIKAIFDIAQALPTLQEVTFEGSFSSFVSFSDAIRGAGCVMCGHVASMKNHLMQEEDHICVTMATSEDSKKSWTVKSSTLRSAHQVLKAIYNRTKQQITLSFRAQDFISISVPASQYHPASCLHIVGLPSEYKKIKLSA